MKKPKISKWQMEKVHPYIPEMYDQLKQGRVSRREFLRVATLLGMGAGAAIVAAQCGSPAEPAAGGQDPNHSHCRAPSASSSSPAQGH